MEKRWELEKRKMLARSGFSGRARVSAAEERGPITRIMQSLAEGQGRTKHQPAKSRTCRWGGPADWM